MTGSAVISTGRCGGSILRRVPDELPVDPAAVRSALLEPDRARSTWLASDVLTELQIDGDAPRLPAPIEVVTLPRREDLERLIAAAKQRIGPSSQPTGQVVCGLARGSQRSSRRAEETTFAEFWLVTVRGVPQIRRVGVETRAALHEGPIARPHELLTELTGRCSVSSGQPMHSPPSWGHLVPSTRPPQPLAGPQQAIVNRGVRALRRLQPLVTGAA